MLWSSFWQKGAAGGFRDNYTMRPICPTCNQNSCAINHNNNGVRHYRKQCDACQRKKVKEKPRKPMWTRSRYKKKAVCDLCGFRSVYPTQMTVYHIDGSLENIDLSNLKSICLNCVEVVKHRHVTWQRGDLIPDFNR